MSTDLFLALLGFATVTLFTPGPNNLMLMASGTNFGFGRTVPHMLGVALGFGAMVFLVGLGLMGLFERLPQLETVLKFAAIAYLGWLAWKIAHAAAPDAGGDDGARPLTFWQAAAFQWVNPKGWSMALTAVAAYAPDRSFATIVIVALAFLTIGLPSSGLWALMGREFRRLLTNPRRLTLFNWTMAALLIASLYPVLFA
ncbi:LysE family translocator [Sinisalibacter aestuarii]|uniref:Lysine transporter LysE n=1 Tax=Sinisalibacter aestuarii TaxID=2949426 RepID=A0ABQ5LUB6_9RHOB|nr:LysE family translocator [Sinisalibacter aestuarii]GKY88363.1 lysine transporter LysE [Sinisalibacter aestuarii]